MGECFYAHGMKKAKGKYVVCIDDDCYLADNVISETIRIFEKYENLGSIGYGLVNPNTNNKDDVLNKQLRVNDEKYDINNSFEIKNYASTRLIEKKY